MSFASEFREFAIKGNVIDLAVGVIIGAAFSKIVDSVVNDLVMPVVGRYVDRLESRLAELGVGAGLHLMTSSGGMISSAVAKTQPVHLIVKETETIAFRAVIAAQ